MFDNLFPFLGVNSTLVLVATVIGFVASLLAVKIARDDRRARLASVPSRALPAPRPAPVAGAAKVASRSPSARASRPSFTYAVG